MEERVEEEEGEKGNMKRDWGTHRGLGVTSTHPTPPRKKEQFIQQNKRKQNKRTTPHPACRKDIVRIEKNSANESRCKQSQAKTTITG